MNLTNITKLETYKPKVEIVTIFPPTWKPTIKELQKDNWQNKRTLVNICKHQKELWAYMIENNIIPKNIIYEIENEAKYGECWRLHLEK